MATGAEIESPNIGKQIVWDMVRARRWAPMATARSGRPTATRPTTAKMQLTGDRLQVSGCVLGICRDGGTWRAGRLT